MLRDTVKYTLFSAIGFSGKYRALRKKHRDKAVVLTYHGVLPAVPSTEGDFEYRNFVTTRRFEEQIQFMLKHYRPLRANDFINEEAELGGGFLITFDDGFRNNHRYAMPILKKYGLQGLFFITTDLIGTRKYLWTEQVTLLLEKTGRQEVSLDLQQREKFPLRTPRDKEVASQKIRKELKIMPPQQLNPVMAQLKDQLDDVPLSVGTLEEERYLFMTWDEVKEMIAADQAIGSHTHTHPMLATLSEADSLRELKLSREAIEAQTGQPCELISYPNGERENFNDLTKRQLRELGYKGAFTQIPQFNTRNTDKLELRRVNIGLKLSLPVFEAVVCGYRS